jgi:hypothetical protein
VFAQDTIKKKQNSVHYNGFINIIPDHYNSILFGQVNIAKGSHEAAQIGLFNWNQNNFGADHLQLSFTFNIVGGSIDNGTQIGIINICADSLRGEQIGFINFAKKRKGIQIGFVNYCDTMASGFSLAFISFVRKGYHAIEIGVSEMYPVNISYKVGGSKSLYTSANLSCNYKNNINNAINGPVFGFGFGSIIPISKSFFINPDFSLQDKFLKGKQGYLSIVTKLSYAITNKIDISAGPAFVFSWVRVDTDPSELHTPMYSLYHNPIDGTSVHRQRNYIGFRFSLRYIIRGM